MKKIFALLLAVACMSMIFSCDNKGNKTLAQVSAMYDASAPTKVVIDTKQEGSQTLTGKYTLVTGLIDGKAATVYTYSYEEFATVEEDKTEAIHTVTGSKEFLEGNGVRVDGKRWDSEGKNFAPTKGSIKINLDEKKIGSVIYEKNTLKFTVSAANTAAVLGEDNAIGYDVSVEITDDGVAITGITIKYEIPATETLAKTTVTIKTVYTYDLEEVTLTK